MTTTCGGSALLAFPARAPSSASISTCQPASRKIWACASASEGFQCIRKALPFARLMHSPRRYTDILLLRPLLRDPLLILFRNPLHHPHFQWVDPSLFHGSMFLIDLF